VSARDNILNRIRTQSQRTGVTSAEELVDVRAHIAERARGPLPSTARENPLTRFISECERLKTSVDSVASLNDVPLALASYLRKNTLKMAVVGWPSLSAQNWAEAGVRFDNRLANANDMVGMTDCFCAIGETGTLLLLSGADTPKLHALLPETHICIVSQKRIVATMEDAFQLLRQEKGTLPRATFLVSGPSRTADIEQTIVIGAHGPYRVHVILVP